MVAGHAEYGAIKNRYTLMLGMDIESAYDSLRNSDMSNSLREFGASEEYIHLYEDFFNFRVNFIEHRGVKVTNYPTQGTPQGGVGSPHLWALVIDDLLNELDKIPGLVKVAYADDIAILVTSSSIARCVEVAQQAIDLCCEWGARHSLRFSPSKTEAMLIWKRNDLDRSVVPQLTIEGKPISYKSKLKYLGLIYNEKLDWMPHLRDKCSKSKNVSTATKGVSAKCLVINQLWPPTYGGALSALD